jgi:hypothetical protein
MQKPQPKAELVIEVHPAATQCITFYVASEDARAWIEQEAPQYGRLFARGAASYVLYLDPLWDRDEVLAYLRSYTQPTPS